MADKPEYRGDKKDAPHAKAAPADYLLRLKSRGEKLRTDRGTLNQHLEEIRENIYPAAPSFISKRVAGEKKMQKVYDETGINANELLAAGLGGSVTNQASNWLATRVLGPREINDLPAVKRWRSHLDDVIYEEQYAPGTGLGPCLDEFYLGLGAFATSIYFIGETTKGELQFQSRALAECFIAENVDGVVDQLWRYYTLKVHQVMDDPEWTPSEKVQKLAAEGKLDDDVEICHATYPRELFGQKIKGKRNKGSQNMEFASCYFEVATCRELQMSGFPEFPYVVARWRKAPGETYGSSSPGMTALPAVKMLQAIECEMIKVMQKLANPVRYLRDDGVTGQIRAIPGSTNIWRGDPNTGIMLEPTSDKVPVTLEWVQGIRNRIRTIFHNDTLQIVDQREMTLGEARMRRTERMRLQAPVSGRLEAEMLGAHVTRVYGILDRKGKVPLAPKEMAGKPITVEFVSPLANAQKSEKLSGLAQMFEYFAPLGPLGLEAIAKKLNMGRTIEGVADTLSVDPDYFNTEEEQAAVEQQAQTAKNIQGAEPIANAANAGAGAVKQLADANAGGGVDMQRLLGRVMQGAQAAGVQQQQRAA